MGEKIEEVATVVKYRAMMPDWSIFEVMLYDEEGTNIPLRTFKYVSFTTVSNDIQKTKEENNVEKYTTDGRIKVTIEGEKPSRAVNLEKA